MFRPALFVLALMLADAPSWAAPASVEEIVRRSVKNTNANWEAAPQYSFTERDVTEKQGKRTTRTYRVMMIEGSPYYRLQSVNDEPLSLRQNANEERKLRDETDRRRRETPAARQKRIAEYGKERRQNEELMREMAAAFKFEPLPEETVAGRRCFVLAATPRPGYKPQSRETRVLTGMRGKMWIDAQQYQWVRVQAEVFRPVAFGLFIAHVQPGTEFLLEQQPVQGSLWLPSHFSMRVKSNILLWSRNSNDDETYSGYTHAVNEQAIRKPGEAP